jgi:putative oxidoreductase
MVDRIRYLSPLSLVRLMAGTVFLTEGIQKFLFPAELGVGRFLRIGIPWAKGMAPFVGLVEIVAGVLLILNILTLWAALLLLADITVALVSTKLPILLGHPVGIFSLPKLPSYGLWAFCHEARTDWSMFLACLAVILASRRHPDPGGDHV